jgi:hypothetical protein
MTDIIWSSYKNYKGPLYKGSISYNPAKPLTEWQKILGVIADCEGKFDTICMHDGTGVTAGFMQWTFISGRLQKLLEYFKTITYPGLFPGSRKYMSVYDVACKDPYGYTFFHEFGFDIIKGEFIDLIDDQVVDPSTPSGREKINSICLGKTKNHAEKLLLRMVEIMQTDGVEKAQLMFAEEELKKALVAKRAVLGKHKTLEKLLEGSWETPAPALFFNLYQNNPKAAMTLFMSAAEEDGTLFDRAWKLLGQSAFGNWSYVSPDYKKYKRTPRIARIQKAIEKYYEVSFLD